MATSDDDGTSERLAQVRAERRHIQRLRVGHRRDRSHHAQAPARAELTVDDVHDTGAPPLLGAGDSREFLAVQQDLLALERGSLVANAELDGGIDFEM
jgi:hypothetical protein